MKSKLSRFLAFFLSIIMLISTLASCSSGLDNYYGNSGVPNTEIGSNESDSDISSDISSDINDDTTNKNENSSDGTIALYSNNDYNAKIIMNKDAKDFNETFFNQICVLLKNITKKAPVQDTDASSYDGPAVLIGETSFAESKLVYETLKNNEAKAVISGNKYVIAYSNNDAAIKLFDKIRSLLSNNASKDEIIINESWNISVTAVNTSALNTSYPNKVMACDQKNKRIVIYDFDKYTQTTSLDSMVVKTFNVGHTTDVKYRENTVFGRVLIVTGDAASANSGIYDYDSGKALWTTANPGSNPHASEILPSGNIVIASTSDNKIRLFKTSALLNNDTATAKKHTEYTLEDAHGVLWDPTYKVLWALGRYELKAYYVQGTGTNETLVEATQMTIKLPEGHRGGHDLSPDYTNTRYLYITVGEFALKIDKKEHSIIADYEYYKLMNAQNIKGFSNNPAGNFFITGEIGTTSFASWCTNSIYFCRYNGKTYEKIKLTSSTGAFYKARALCGTYQ